MHHNKIYCNRKKINEKLCNFIQFSMYHEMTMKKFNRIKISGKMNVESIFLLDETKIRIEVWQQLFTPPELFSTPPQANKKLEFFSFFSHSPLSSSSFVCFSLPSILQALFAIIDCMFIGMKK